MQFTGKSGQFSLVVLWQALASLIEARRAQSRFQLVLITHDEASQNNMDLMIVDLPSCEVHCLVQSFLNHRHSSTDLRSSRYVIGFTAFTRMMLARIFAFLLLAVLISGILQQFSVSDSF